MLWAEAIPPLPQAPGPPRPGLVPVSIIGAEDEDFENELKTVGEREVGWKSFCPRLPEAPSSVSLPASGPVLHPQMLSLCPLSLPVSFFNLPGTCLLSPLPHPQCPPLQRRLLPCLF